MDQQLIEAIGQMLSPIMSQLATLDKKIDRTNLVLENDIRPSIMAIAEGHAMLADKLSSIGEIKNQIDEIKGSITAIEAVVVKNRTNIIDLQEAKYK